MFIFFDRKGKTTLDQFSDLSYGISLGVDDKKNIYITGLTKNPNLSDGKLTVGQVLKSVNGKDGSAFLNIIELKNYLGECINKRSNLKITTLSGAELNLLPQKNEVITIPF